MGLSVAELTLIEQRVTNDGYPFTENRGFCYPIAEARYSWVSSISGRGVDASCEV